MTGKIAEVSHKTRILDALSAAGGEIVSRDNLIMAMYEGREEADYAETILYLYIIELRKRGYNITTTYGKGYSLSGATQQ